MAKDTKTAVISHSEDASKVLDRVRALRELIPGFAQPAVAVAPGHGDQPPAMAGGAGDYFEAPSSTYRFTTSGDPSRDSGSVRGDDGHRHPPGS